MNKYDVFGADMERISRQLVEGKIDCGIDINITKECNFRCTYCYEGDSCLGTEDISENLDDVFKLIDGLLVNEWWLSKFGFAKISLWGGEPTIKPDILRRIVNKYKDNSMVKFLMYTNGQDVNVIIDIFECIKDKIDIQVSYDGGVIHQRHRLDKFGNDTKELCRNAVFRLHEEGFNVSIKSTIDPRTDIPDMIESWRDIEEIYNVVGKGISYAITPDNSRNSDFNVEEVRVMFKEMAKLEIPFYKKHGHHLMSWFGGQKTKCVFFEGGFFVDTNGDLMPCHGCGYIDDTEPFVFGNIKDDDVIEKIKNSMARFGVPYDEICERCVSTCCLNCNSSKYINSNKQEFLDKWYDFHCQENHCKIFREFGKIDRAVKEILGR